MTGRILVTIRSLFTLDLGEVAISNELRRSLELVIWAVCFGIVFFNITTGFPLAGFAKELGFGDLLYAVMLAMPVLGGTVQVVASLILERIRKRKKLFLWSLLVNRVPWIFIAFLPFLVHSRSPLFVLLLIFLTIGALGGAFVNVTFLSWMGDLVPLEIRGRFFGHRSMISMLAAITSGLLVGKILDAVIGIWGFALVFSIASLAGIAEFWFFQRTYDPPMTTLNQGESLRVMFQKVLGCRPFVRFLCFIVFWNFSVNVASPFFNLYMLKHLHMDFLEIAFYVQVISNVATIFFVRAWGRLTDRFGNKPVAAFATLVAIFLPIIWCFTTPGNWFFVIPVIQTLAGIFWPGIDLITSNLLLKLAPAENRSLYVGVLNFFLGVVGTALAYLVGGYILENIIPLWSSWSESFFGWRLVPYYYVFGLSSLLRFLAFQFLLPKVEETGAQSFRVMVREVFRRSSYS